MKLETQTIPFLLEEIEKARLEGDTIKAYDIQHQIMRLLRDEEKLYPQHPING